MKILDKTNNGLNWCYSIFIAAEDIKQAIRTQLENVAKKVRMDGFRPGKVPVHMIERMYGSSVRSEAIKGLISSAVNDVFAQDKINVSFNYSTDVVSEDEEGIKFELKFESLPTFEVKDFSDIHVNKYIVDLEEADIDRFLEDVRSGNKKWEEADTKEAEEGDKIVLDLVIDAQKMKKFKQPPMNDIEIIVGDKELINGISQNLVGAKLGESREFDITYPENFADKTLAGKKINYIAHMKHIFVPKAYEMNDEFAIAIGKKDMAEAREWAKKVLQSKYEFMAKDFMRRDLLDCMENMYDFDVPQNMLNLEQNEVYESVKKEFLRAGKELPETLEADCKKVALRRVRLGFVVAEIAKRDNIYVTNEELNEAIRNIVFNYPGREREIFDRCIKDRSMLTAIKGPILENKVINYLFDLIKLDEVHCTSAKILEMDEELSDVFHYETSTKEKVDLELHDTQVNASTEKSEKVEEVEKPKEPVEKKTAKKSTKVKAADTADSPKKTKAKTTKTETKAEKPAAKTEKKTKTTKK